LNSFLTCANGIAAADNTNSQEGSQIFKASARVPSAFVNLPGYALPQNRGVMSNIFPLLEGHQAVRMAEKEAKLIWDFAILLHE